MRTKIYHTITALFILLWAYTATNKLVNYDLTSIKIKLQPLPDWSKRFITWFITSTELLSMLLLAWKRTRLLGFLLSASLMSAFTLYIEYVLHLPKSDIPCSCGGIISLFGWKKHLYFNLFWLALSVIGVILYRKEKPKQKNDSVSYKIMDT